MHYYQHHIGDFIKDTANLNDHQLATYMRMVWVYYSEEKPFTGELEDIAFAMRSDEKTVGLILRHYFKQAPEGWRHSRCDREILEFHSKKKKATASANARWRNAKTTADAIPPQSERNANASLSDANQEPITNNQEPILKEPRRKRTGDFDAQEKLSELGVTPEVAKDFLAIRKKKSAPLTATALSGLTREAGKAGLSMNQALEKCCSRGWQGFEASWFQNQADPARPKKGPIPENFAEMNYGEAGLL